MLHAPIHYYNNAHYIHKYLDKYFPNNFPRHKQKLNEPKYIDTYHAGKHQYFLDNTNTHPKSAYKVKAGREKPGADALYGTACHLHPGMHTQYFHVHHYALHIADA